MIDVSYSKFLQNWRDSCHSRCPLDSRIKVYSDCTFINASYTSKSYTRQNWRDFSNFITKYVIYIWLSHLLHCTFSICMTCLISNFVEKWKNDLKYFLIYAKYVRDDPNIIRHIHDCKCLQVTRNATTWSYPFGIIGAILIKSLALALSKRKISLREFKCFLTSYSA